jgi:hypothetical protein
MIALNPTGDFLTWLLFSLVVAWALWEGLPEFAQWLGRNSDGREDIQFFPDEVRGEPGPRTIARPGGDEGAGRSREAQAGDGVAASR